MCINGPKHVSVYSMFNCVSMCVFVFVYCVNFAIDKMFAKAKKICIF